ncbi:MAG: hypothetical protein L3J93_03805 [Thermoplasmata archaeon]|nr:hypothetical protein [Thermoplasmata archaeon]
MSALTASARYAHLVARLRSRQITMEEATELFEMMQLALARTSPVPARSRASRVAATTPKGSGPHRAPGARLGKELTDDELGLSLLALGAGAGLLAALFKRHAEGPRTPPP